MREGEYILEVLYYSVTQIHALANLKVFQDL